MASKIRDDIADFLSHPNSKKIFEVIKFFKSSKSFWSVAFLLTLYIISQFTEPHKADVIQKNIEQSASPIEKIFWQLVDFFLVNDSYFGLTLTTILLVGFGFLYYQETKKTPLTLQHVDFFTNEIERKNQEIDKLKAKLKESPLSNEERAALAKVVASLQIELDKKKSKISSLEEAMSKAQDIKIVQKATEILNTKGIDEAIKYFESIDFEEHRRKSIEYSKALLVQAGLYAYKNDHEKAKATYQKSIEMDRNFDNIIAYVVYLAKQNIHKEAIAHLLTAQTLNLSNEQKSALLNNLALLYQNQNKLTEAEKAYVEALEKYRELAKVNPEAYGMNFAQMIIMGVALFGRQKTSLAEAIQILEQFNGIHRAEKLMGIARHLNTSIK